MRANITLNCIKLPDFLNCCSSYNAHGTQGGAKHPKSMSQICKVLLPENVLDIYHLCECILHIHFVFKGMVTRFSVY